MKRIQHVITVEALCSVEGTSSKTLNSWDYTQQPFTTNMWLVPFSWKQPLEGLGCTWSSMLRTIIILVKTVIDLLWQCIPSPTSHAWHDRTQQTCMLSVWMCVLCVHECCVCIRMARGFWCRPITSCLLVCAGEMEVAQSMPEAAVSDKDPVLSQPVHCEWTCVLVFCSCKALQGNRAVALGVGSAAALVQTCSTFCLHCSVWEVHCSLQKTRQQKRCGQRQSHPRMGGAYPTWD